MGRFGKPGTAHRNPGPGHWGLALALTAPFSMKVEECASKGPDIVQVTRRATTCQSAPAATCGLSPPSHYAKNKVRPPTLQGCWGGMCPVEMNNNEAGGGAEHRHLPWWVLPIPHGQTPPTPPRQSPSTVLQRGPRSPPQAWTQPPDHLNTAPRGWLEARLPLADIYPTGRKYEKKTRDGSRQAAVDHGGETAD